MARKLRSMTNILKYLRDIQDDVSGSESDEEFEGFARKDISNAKRDVDMSEEVKDCSEVLKKGDIAIEVDSEVVDCSDEMDERFEEMQEDSDEMYMDSSAEGDENSDEGNENGDEGDKETDEEDENNDEEDENSDEREKNTDVEDKNSDKGEMEESNEEMEAESDEESEKREAIEDDCDDEDDNWGEVSSDDDDREEIGDDSEEDSDATVWEVSVDKSVWKKHTAEDPTSVSKGRLRAENILRVRPGPTSYAIRKANDIVTAFGLFFDENMLDHICKCTNAEAKRSLKNWSTTKNELLAFIGICYARGSLGLKNMSVSNIFSTKYGPPLIRSIMPRDRFKEILKFLRFDVKETRKERLTTDKFALASFMWNSFIKNCKSCYNPGANVTIDEQLFPSKTRCPFTQFIKEKPDKFGVKYFLLVDVDSKYILNGFPYTGSDGQRKNKSVGEQVVLRLMKPYFNGGYNVTTDNFFTSLDLAVALKEKKITLVGTANKKRRWVPPTAKLKNPRLPLYDSNIYLGPNSTTLTLYQSKRNKSVSVLSSLHKSVKITNTPKRKPEPIVFYNNTKYGVDIADQMAKKYSVKSASRRWPVHVFYNILDLAGINAWIIYKEVTGSNISRLNFLLQLAESLGNSCVASKTKVIVPNDTESCPKRNQKVALRSENALNLLKRTSTKDKNENSNCDCKSTKQKRQHCQMKKCSNKTFNTKFCYDCKKSICGKCISSEQRWCIECRSHECCKK